MDLTALYTSIDDFYKEISNFDIWEKLHSGWCNKRGTKKKLSLSEIITLNILRFQLRITDLKSFHKLVKDRYSEEFPSIPNYENYLKVTNKSTERYNQKLWMGYKKSKF